MDRAPFSKRTSISRCLTPWRRPAGGLSRCVHDRSSAAIPEYQVRMSTSLPARRAVISACARRFGDRGYRVIAEFPALVAPVQASSAGDRRPRRRERSVRLGGEPENVSASMPLGGTACGRLGPASRGGAGRAWRVERVNSSAAGFLRDRRLASWELDAIIGCPDRSLACLRGDPGIRSARTFLRRGPTLNDSAYASENLP